MIKINGKKNYKNLSATAKITGKKIKKITKFSLKKKETNLIETLFHAVRQKLAEDIKWTLDCKDLELHLSINSKKNSSIVP